MLSDESANVSAQRYKYKPASFHLNNILQIIIKALKCHAGWCAPTVDMSALVSTQPYGDRNTVFHRESNTASTSNLITDTMLQFGFRRTLMCEPVRARTVMGSYLTGDTQSNGMEQ